MSDWMSKFVEQKDDEKNELTTEEEFAAQNKIAEIVDEENPGLLEDYEDALYEEEIEEINKTNRVILASLKAINEELKAGMAIVQNKIDNVSTHMQAQINALDDKVTRSMLAMEDGNEKRALLFAQALEEINDLVADPDQMTDVFRVAPDIAMEAIEREAQGVLAGEKPFDPDDEIFLPESPEEEPAKEESKDSQGPLPDEEEFDELGVGEIQALSVPEELDGYNEKDYNLVMDYINGEIKWSDMMKHAGGMRAAKALVDPVKAYMGIE